MTGESVNKLLLGGAYRIFFEEIAKHIEASREYLGSAKGITSEERASELGARFHTIKGGAGFFGLHDIASFAGQIEDLLLKRKDEKLGARASQSHELFCKLAEAAKALPAPQPVKKDP